MFVTKKPVGMLNYALVVNSQEEADYLMNYLLSPLFVFVANNYRKTSGFTPFVKNNQIPDLRGVSYDSIYRLFGLDEKEVEYIEKKQNKG
jgi:hypothetical protein